MPDVCLRVIPLSGPARGGGGSACAHADVVSREGTLLATVLPDDPSQPAVIAGIVPDDVRSVRLVNVRTGASERRPIRDNAFLFETTRSAKQLRYRDPNGRTGERPVGL